MLGWDEVVARSTLENLRSSDPSVPRTSSTPSLGWAQVVTRAGSAGSRTGERTGGDVPVSGSLCVRSIGNTRAGLTSLIELPPSTTAASSASGRSGVPRSVPSTTTGRVAHLPSCGGIVQRLDRKLERRPTIQRLEDALIDGVQDDPPPVVSPSSPLFLSDDDRNRYLRTLAHEGGSVQVLAAFAEMPEAARADRAVAMAACRESGQALKHAHKAMRADRGVVLEALRHGWPAMHYADEALRMNQEVMLEAVRDHGHPLEYVHESLKGDKQVVEVAVRRNGFALQHAHESLRSDRDLVFTAVQHRGFALRYACDSLRADRELVKAAVRQNPSALQYAHNSLRADREVVADAVRQGGYALQYAHSSLRADAEFMAEAAKLHPDAAFYAEPVAAPSNRRQACSLSKTTRARRRGEVLRATGGDVLRTGGKGDTLRAPPSAGHTLRASAGGPRATSRAKTTSCGASRRLPLACTRPTLTNAFR